MLSVEVSNTHANRWNANRLLENVYSVDIASSYPSVILSEQYPREFIKKNPIKFEQALDLNRACLIHIRMFDIKLKNEAFGCPYLAIGKCERILNPEKDNGRILSAEALETWITEIDFSILVKEYEFKYEILELYTAKKDYLPDEFRELVMELFTQKTILKGGDEYTYARFKEKINSVYGMMVQNPCKFNYKFNGSELVINEDETIEELIKNYQRKGWIPYQWGVWVTSYARLKLEEAIHSIPPECFVYADTDSVKFLGDHIADIEKLNKYYKNEKYSALDRNGVRHYLGIFENETPKPYKYFKTLGAKKYCYVDSDGELHLTVSGVHKKKGAIELGNINNFEEGFIFTEAGGNQAIYNDYPPISSIMMEGKEIEIISNVALYPSTYTLGMAADYERLINILSYSDIRESLHYER